MKNVRLFLPLLLAALLLPAALHFSRAQAPADTRARVDAIFEQWDSTTSPGCAVAVARDGRTILSRAYGMAELEHDITNTPATIFEAGSVSKQFTAAAIMLLALEGKLALDDDVRTYVPEVPDYGTPITLRHLLNHTSGLRDWGSVAGISGWGRSNRTHNHAHVLDILSRQSALNYPPGEQYSYTNSGFNLLAVIVDRVSGIPFAEFSRERIFEPLGMEHTGWRDDYRRLVPGRATAYSPRGNTFYINQPIEDVHGNGGLLTTVGDLIIWNESLDSGRLAGPELVAMMHEQGVLNDGTRISYAGGLQVGTRNGVPSVSHTGATSGYRAYLARFPGQHLSVALLCNTTDANPGGLGGQVADLFLPEPPPRPERPEGRAEAPQPRSPAPPPFVPSPADMEAYAGTYYSPDAETVLIVSVEEGRLVLRRRPDSRMTMTAGNESDQFRSSLGQVRFIREGRGPINEFSLSLGRVFDMRFYRTPLF